MITSWLGTCLLDEWWNKFFGCVLENVSTLRYEFNEDLSNLVHETKLQLN